jgi:hypothetical protein
MWLIEGVPAMTSDKQAIRAYLAEIGSKGGKTTAERLTKKQRVERARKAVAAREASKRSTKGKVAKRPVLSKTAQRKKGGR